MQRILVTGGSGFIGSHVIDLIVDRGMKAIAFDRYFRPYIYPEGTHVVSGDVRDLGSVLLGVEKADGVINLAGILGTSETIKRPKPSVDTNILGALNVFEACLKTQTPVVQIGVGNHFMNNSYAITKSTAERLGKMYAKELDLPVSIVRGYNAYGERQKHKPVRKMIPNFIVNALRGDPITVYGSGEQIMDMIYVRDLAEVLLRALTVDHGKYGFVYEAGSGIETTVNEIAKLVCNIVGGESHIIHREMRPGEVRDGVVLADPSTLAPLGISSEDFISLEEGLEKTVEWYRKHYSWK